MQLLYPTIGFPIHGIEQLQEASSRFQGASSGHKSPMLLCKASANFPSFEFFNLTIWSSFHSVYPFRVNDLSPYRDLLFLIFEYTP
jgi:hypothetical protein